MVMIERSPCHKNNSTCMDRQHPGHLPHSIIFHSGCNYTGKIIKKELLCAFFLKVIGFKNNTDIQ